MIFLKEFLEKVNFEKNQAADDKQAWTISHGAKSQISKNVELKIVIIILDMLKALKGTISRRRLFWISM